jgi:hypothetical protein
MIQWSKKFTDQKCKKYLSLTTWREDKCISKIVMWLWILKKRVKLWIRFIWLRIRSRRGTLVNTVFIGKTLFTGYLPLVCACPIHVVNRRPVIRSSFTWRATRSRKPHLCHEGGDRDRLSLCACFFPRWTMSKENNLMTTRLSTAPLELAALETWLSAIQLYILSDIFANLPKQS